MSLLTAGPLPGPNFDDLTSLPKPIDEFEFEPYCPSIIINFFLENKLARLHNLPVLHLQDEEDCSCSSRVCNCRLILSTTHFLWFFNSVCHWNVQPRSPSFSRPHFTAARYDILLCCHWKFHEQGIHACQWNIHIINQEEPGSSMDSFLSQTHTYSSPRTPSCIGLEWRLFKICSPSFRNHGSHFVYKSLCLVVVSRICRRGGADQISIPTKFS